MVREAETFSEAAATESGAARYELEVDLSNTNTSQTQLVLLTGEGKDVLEVGPATGYVSKVLRERGCRVTGIEIDPEAAERASEFCERVIVGSIEQIDLGQELGDARFDVAMFGDVLEHLVDPQQTLRRTRQFLKPSGQIVASIPNIAHGDLRLALLSGRFRYTPIGLLDRTHLRFYDRSGVEELFAGADLRISEWRRVTAEVLNTEVDVPEAILPPHLVDAVRAAPEATTYQFIVVAEPATNVHIHDSRDDPADLGPLWQLENRRNSLEARVPELEAEIAERDREIGAARAEFEHATGTRGYRSLQRLYRAFDRIAPPDTRRRRALRAIAKPFLSVASGSS